MNLELIFIPVIQALIVSIACLWFHKRGYQKGRDAAALAIRDDAYWQGRREADNWWLNVEQQVDQARQKIWKEGA